MTATFLPKAGDVVRANLSRNPAETSWAIVRVCEEPNERHPTTFEVEHEDGGRFQVSIYSMMPASDEGRPRVLSSTIHGVPFEQKSAVQDRSTIKTIEMDPLKRVDVEVEVEYTNRALFDAVTSGIQLGPDLSAAALRKRMMLPTPDAVDHALEMLGDIMPTGVPFDSETPGRMVRALRDMTAGYGVDVKQLLKTFPIEGDHGLVVVRDIPFASLCEHHVLPFSGTCSVVYIPTDRIVGLSKIPRLVRAFSRRLQVQERLGKEIADALHDFVGAKGVMVVIRGRHACMALRGAESPAEMVTSYVLGVFYEDPTARGEALELLR